MGKTPCPERTKLTPPRLAKLWGVDPAKIHQWIRSGELRAIDVSSTRGGRPRYLIDVADVAAFEAGREVRPPSPVPRRRTFCAAIPEYVTRPEA